ncbi:MAG: hypothetical protein AAF761_04855 [Pseudomonadota bacterium]
MVCIPTIPAAALPKFVAASIVSGFLAAPALAQGNGTCGPRDEFVQQLENRFMETSKGVGLASADQVVEFWSSEENGTFSILITYPNGVSCMMASGQNWTDLPGEPVSGPQL